MQSPVLQELSDIIGIAAALKLAADFGGTEEYIPKVISPDHKIAKSIGPEAAQKLAEWICGGRLEIPRAVAANANIRNQEILKDVANGYSKKSIARKYALTNRWVRTITNSSKDPDQEELF